MKNEISNILNLIKNGNNSEAVKEAKKLHIKNPTNLDAIKILTYTFIQIGNFEKVIEILNMDMKKSNKVMILIIWVMHSQLEHYEKPLSFCNCN